MPLADAVREVVADQAGVRPSGPVRVLTNLSSFGHCFNPVSFYYCMDEAAESVEAVVAEVTNTPWGERHAYVLAAAARIAYRPNAGAVLAGNSTKALHVSPFMGMDERYEWRLSVPGETLSVHIASSRKGRLAFDATLSLRRQRAHEVDAGAHERALSGERAADARADLRPGGAAEVEGRAGASPSQGGPGVSRRLTPPWRRGMTTRLARTIAHALLRRIHSGSLTVLEDGRAQATFGSGAPHATVHVRSPRAWRQAVARQQRARRGICPGAVGLV